MTRAGIVGIGSYLPDRVVGNEEMSRLCPDAPPSWIAERTGIHERRYAAPDQATSDLAIGAASAALDDAQLRPQDLDWVIVSTSTPDSPQPPTACRVQAGLGAWSAAAFDINAVCSGFVYGLELAASLVATHPGSRALVVAAEVYSRCLDFSDRRTSVLLGDGAGAAVVSDVPNGGLLDIDLRSRGDLQDMIYVEAGGSRRPASHDSVDDGGHYFRMQGRDVREFVLTNVPAAIRESAQRAGAPEDIRHIVPHQPNYHLLSELDRELGLEKAAMHRTVDRLGNVGSASVPVTLDAAYHAGQLSPGDTIVLSSFGGGMAMGHATLIWTHDFRAPQ